MSVPDFQTVADPEELAGWWPPFIFQNYTLYIFFIFILIIVISPAKIFIHYNVSFASSAKILASPLQSFIQRRPSLRLRHVKNWNFLRNEGNQIWQSLTKPKKPSNYYKNQIRNQWTNPTKETIPVIKQTKFKNKSLNITKLQHKLALPSRAHSK